MLILKCLLGDGRERFNLWSDLNEDSIIYYSYQRWRTEKKWEGKGKHKNLMRTAICCLCLLCSISFLLASCTALFCFLFLSSVSPTPAIHEEIKKFVNQVNMLKFFWYFIFCEYPLNMKAQWHCTASVYIFLESDFEKAVD